MPELKRSFQSGRMNKDLDERLVPNGEYIDAMNIEVSTSEDSDVGTVQTAMGNIDKSPNIPEGYCVGKIADNRNLAVLLLANFSFLYLCIIYSGIFALVDNIA